MEGVLKFLPGVAWRALVGGLIPYTVFGEIKEQHQSDDSRLRAVIECWLQDGGSAVGKEPSWRTLIWTLDDTNETKAADTVRYCAEPLPGKSCDSITFLYSV